MPFVKKPLYDALCVMGGVPVVEASARKPRKAASGQQAKGRAADPVAAAHLPADWDSIAVGTLALATEGGSDGWYEAIVLDVEGDTLRLRWRDWPELPVFLRHRNQLALLPPNPAVHG